MRQDCCGLKDKLLYQPRSFLRAYSNHSLDGDVSYTIGQFCHLANHLHTHPSTREVPQLSKRPSGLLSYLFAEPSFSHLARIFIHNEGAGQTLSGKGLQTLFLSSADKTDWFPLETAHA